MFYKLLGYVVWHLARWYVGRRYAAVLPSRRTAAAAAVGVTVVGLAVTAARRDRLGED